MSSIQAVEGRYIDGAGVGRGALSPELEGYFRGHLEAARLLFREYLGQVNALREHAEWYNTVVSNCTSSIWLLSRINPEHVPWSWKILLSGYLPEYLYEQGRLNTSVPFEELQRRGLINARARAADQAADFSQQIRAGVP